MTFLVSTACFAIGFLAGAAYTAFCVRGDNWSDRE